jgi:hypothetical protein
MSSLAYCSALLLLAATIATSAAAQGPPPSSNTPTYLHAIDPLGIDQDIASGKSEILEALSKKALPQAIHAYVLAGYYRSIFQLKSSTKYAKQCYSESMKALPGATVEALRCGELIAGNEGISGHTAAWARSMQKTRDQLYAIATKSLHTTDVVFPGFGTISDRIDMRSFYDFPDETITGDENPNIAIPRVLPSGERPARESFETPVCQLGIRCFGKYLYDIKVNVNGHDIVAVIDTGSTTSVVTPTAARVLGVRVNKSPYYELQSSQSVRSSAHLGYVDSIRIKTRDEHDIVLKNSKVKVGGQTSHGIKMVLGLNVLRELGSVLLKKNYMVINPNGTSIDCRTPLHIASDTLGGYSVFFKYPIDGYSQDEMLDTGENQYIFGTSLADAKAVSSQEMETFSEYVTGNVESIYYPAHITLRRGVHAKSMIIAIFKNYDDQYPYVIGDDVLQDFDIFLDFKTARACLIPLP